MVNGDFIGPWNWTIQENKKKFKKIFFQWNLNFWISQDEIIDGKRDIASYYYPSIGPYATNDDRVLDYHFELMKLAKVDGIILDWYGEVGSNGDIDQGLVVTSSF